VVVRRDLEHAKQGLGIFFPLSFLHRPLEVQKGRALHEKTDKALKPASVMV
jgi:hypothetical protein